MSDVTRPILRWHGGKWRLAPWIIGHFPPHRVYVEPFGGAASVLMRKPRLWAECYNDLDGDVVNVFQVLRDRAAAADLRARLALTPFARAEFDATYEPAADAIDAAHKTIVRSFMGHGSDSVSRSCRTGFRAKMSDNRAFAAQAWSNYADAVPFFCERLQGVLIEQRDAREVMTRLDGADTLHYVDPPYMIATRSSLAGGRSATHGYRHELTDDDHDTLLTFLDGLRGYVVLSGYPSEDYDRALGHWRRVEMRALADGAKERTEVLWINPAAAAALDAVASGSGMPLFGILNEMQEAAE